MKVIAISGWKRSGKDASAQYLIDKHNFKRVAFADPLKDRVAEEYKIPREHCDDPKFKESPLQQYPVIPKDDFTLAVAKLMHKEFRTIGGQQPMEYYVDPSGAFLGVMGRHVEQLYWTPRALCILKGSVNRSVDSSFWVGEAINLINSNRIDAVKLDVSKDPNDKEANQALVDAACKKMNDHNDSLKFVISDLRYRSEIDQLRQAFGRELVTVRINRFDTSNSTDPSERDLDNGKFDVTIDNKGTIEELFAKIEEVVK